MRGKMLLPADMERVMGSQPTRPLWAQAQAGDAAAFGALYQRHARVVYQFCFWRTADAGLAEVQLCRLTVRRGNDQSPVG